MFLNFDATDGSGTLKLSAYTENAEKMFKAMAEDFLAMTDQELKAYYDKEEEKFRSTHICLDVMAASFQLYNKWIKSDRFSRLWWLIDALLILKHVLCAKSFTLLSVITTRRTLLLIYQYTSSPTSLILATTNASQMGSQGCGVYTNPSCYLLAF